MSATLSDAGASHSMAGSGDSYADGHGQRHISTMTDAATAAMPNEAQGSALRYALTIAAMLLVTMVFFRSVVPRIPRLFLRGRLRVKRMGFRGIRGIEWRSKAFTSSSSSSSSTRSPDSDDTNASYGLHRRASVQSTKSTSSISCDPSDRGFELRIQHIYLSFRWRAKQSRTVDPAAYDVNSVAAAPQRIAWITLHVDGVAVALPKPTASEVQALKQKRRQQRVEEEQEAQRTANEAEEARLRELMESRPSSPLLGSGGGRASPSLRGQVLSPSISSSNRISPLPAFSAALGRAPGSQPDSTSTVVRAIPFQAATWMVQFVRHTLVPLSIITLLRVCRALAYLVASLLPLLSNVIDVEVRKVEVYAAEIDAVVRLDRISLGAHMEVVPAGSPTQAKVKLDRSAAQQQACYTIRQRMSSALASMPLRLGTGARGAASLVSDGLPGLRANLRIATEGLQVFDACKARQNQSQRQSFPGEPPSKRFGQNSRPSSSASFIVPSKEEHEWTSFSRFGLSAPAKPTRRGSTADLARTSSEQNKNESPRNRWSDCWKDWAHESAKNSIALPRTAWEQGIPSCRESPIAMNARLTAIQDVSTFTVGLVLGRAVSAKESLHVGVKLAAITVGADALIGMAERKQDEKEQAKRTERDDFRDDDKSASDSLQVRETDALSAVQARPSAKVIRLLENLGSIMLDVPDLFLDLSSKASFAAIELSDKLSTEEGDPYHLPSSLQLFTHVRGVHFSVKTSHLPDEMHQRWLGTCGVKGWKPSMSRRTLSDGFRWTLGRRGKVAFVEDRRVFAVRAHVAHTEVRLGIDGQTRELQSEVLRLSDLSIESRSSWSPAGLLLAATASDDGTARFFAGDVNEQAVVIESRVGKLFGSVNARHLCALLTFHRFHQAHRTEQRRQMGLLPDDEGPNQEVNKATCRSPVHVPRFAFGMSFGVVSYRLDASALAAHDSGAPPLASSDAPEVSLIVDVPSLQFNATGSYQDRYVRRSEAERKAAWKSLAKDELEWSLYSPPLTLLQKYSTTSGANTGVDGKATPRSLSGDYLEWQNKSIAEGGQAPASSSLFAEDEEEQRVAGDDDDDDQPSGSKAVTMAEALKQMREIQARQASGRQPKVRSQKKKSQQPAPVKPVGTHALQCEARCSFDSIKLFWALDGNDVTSQRRSRKGDDLQLPAAPLRLPTKSKTHRHILALNDFDLCATLSVPGTQDLASNAVALHPERRSLDIGLNLEEIDLDMWHNSSLDATRTLLRAVSAANRHVDFSVDDDKKVAKSEEEKSVDNTNEHHDSGAAHSSSSASRSSPPPPPLIDLLRPDTSLYLSLGAIVAHIGGTDERCDRTVSRGVGVDVKRAVLQVAVAKTELRRGPDALHYAMSARSALGLSEDQRATVGALAVRHGKAASAKMTLFEFGVFPLLDAEQATSQHVGDPSSAIRRQTGAEDSFEESIGSPSIVAPAVWDFQQTRPRTTEKRQSHKKFRQQDRSNFMVWMPTFSVRANLVPRKSKVGTTGSNDAKSDKPEEDLSIVTEDTRLLSFKIELLHTYCILVAFASMKGLVPKLKRVKSKRDHSVTQPQDRSPAARPKFAMPTLRVNVVITDIHIAVTLPTEIQVFVSLHRSEAVHVAGAESTIGFEWLTGAVESPATPSRELWEEIARIRDCKIRFEHSSGRASATSSSSTSSSPSATEAAPSPLKIIVSADGMRLRVPFNYLVHPIIDNTVIAVKTTKQLLHQFVKGGTDSVIIPVAEGPKHLPIVSLYLRILAVEAEDDPFETRLNIIWRSGGDENQARAERQSAFEEKMHSLESVRARNTSHESFSGAPSTASSTDSESYDDRLTRQAAIAVDEARRRLHAFNSTSWIRRFTNARAEQARREELNKRRIYGRLPPNPKLHNDFPIKMAPLSRATPLIRSSMSQVHLTIAPPSFPESKLRAFLSEQGDGVPEDLEYSLLVPLNVHLRMNEWKIDLRDYPMPLLHFPPINRHKQPHTLAAIEVKMDLCIAEQLGSHEALRHLTAVVVPAATGRPDAIEYGISVPRMSMPTKIFGSPVININSSYTTRLVWGQSVQPAIHDVVRVFEGITSPPHDPSPKLGFWDKLSLILQGRLKIRFPGDGQFHVYLKGSRDPYHILGHGAGWVKCWRGNVELLVGFENANREVFQLVSDEYILAIPDLKDYIDRAATGTESRSLMDEEEQQNAAQAPTLQRSRSSKHEHDNTPLASAHHRYMREPEFKKICLKLTNGVRWGFGLLLERSCTDASCTRRKRCHGIPFYRECRLWTRKPHWQVYTRSKEFVNTLPEDKRGDSYEGWRSDHLHFSVSIYSPADGLRTHGDNDNGSAASRAVNNLYFTPLAWEHFWAWMRLFDGALSLPIRQGKLFPRSLEQSPKFGRHLGTIKYRFDIAPLFISHLYPQEEKADWARGRTTLLGIKARMSTFHMDFHQRQQEMVVSDRPELGGAKKRFHKPFYEAEVDLADINFRTLAGQFQEPEKRLYPLQDVDENDENEDGNIFGGEPDLDAEQRDSAWYDLHDFVEVDWAPPESGKQPRIKLIEAMSCPRFNYYRRIESQAERQERTMKGNGTKTRNDNENDEDDDVAKLEATKFGHEDTHSCLVGKAPPPPKIQITLAEKRLDILQDELANFVAKGVGSEPASASFMGDKRAKAEDEGARKAGLELENDLRRKIKLVKEYISMLHNVESLFSDFDDTEDEEGNKAAREPEEHVKTAEHMTHGGDLRYFSKYYSKEAVREWQAFDNRYFVHNPVVFFSNATRDVLLKYYLSSRKRRGVVHSLSARAVRYIRKLVKTEDSTDGRSSSSVKNRQGAHRMQSASSVTTQSTTEELDQEQEGDSDDAASSARVSRDDGDNGDVLRGMLNKTVEFMMPHMDDDDEKGARTKKSRGNPAVRDSGVGAEATHDEAGVRHLFDPHDGISDEFEVRRSNVCIVLKPQIVLRSQVNDKSTVIITAARTRLHNYSVKDPRVEEDSVNERVLYRNFIGVDALQLFHPSQRCTITRRALDHSGFVYVPLETLVDMRYETSDFDRIAPQTDATIQYDKFNKLRLNDPAHPVAADAVVSSNKAKKKSTTTAASAGANEHLQHTMDLFRVRCARFTVSANAEQFGAIYNVVTDLLLYRDPAYREHAKKLEVLMFSYDWSDVEALADMVQSLQVRIRQARELHSQYHLHFDHLNDQGRLDFLSLKAEINDLQDELNLLLEAITQVDDKSDKEKKSALRLDARAHDVGWNMMGNREGELLAKLSIRGAHFTWLNKADNSVANSLSVIDLNAVNVDPNAVFQEIITKYNSVDDHPMKERRMLLSAAWSVLAPVGGIAIVDHFELDVHPLRIQIERRIGRQIEEYVFGGMREKRREREEQEQRSHDDGKGGSDDAGVGKVARKRTVSMRLRRLKAAMTGHSNSDSKLAALSYDKDDVARNTDSSAPPSPRSTTKTLPPLGGVQPPPTSRRSLDGRRATMALHRSSSRTLISSGSSAVEDSRSGRLPGSSANSTAGGSSTALNSKTGGDHNGNESDDNDSDEENGQRAIAQRNATEMRERASRNVTFVSVRMSQTIFCLSYKSEKQKSMLDLYDLTFRLPRLEYRNRTWAHADLASHLKRDIIKAAWKQRSTLIKGVISQRRPPATQRVAQAALTLTRSRHSPAASLTTANSHSPTTENRNAFTGALLEGSQSSSGFTAPPTTGNSFFFGANTGGGVGDQSESAPEFKLQVDPPSFSSSMSASHSGNLSSAAASPGRNGSTAAARRQSRSSEDTNESRVSNGNDDASPHFDGVHDNGDRDHDGDNDSEQDDDASDASSSDGQEMHELSDVGEEAEWSSAEQPSPQEQRRQSYHAGDEVSRQSSKTSHHSVPGASTLASSQQKLGKLLAKTLQSRRRGTSPNASSIQATQAIDGVADRQDG